MDCAASGMKRARRTRGETLVETVVAFAVLAILLTMATSVVKGGIMLNGHAVSQMEKLNADCINVETNADLIDAGAETLTLTYAGGTRTDTNEVRGYDSELFINVWSGKLLRIFRAVEVHGG